MWACLSPGRAETQEDWERKYDWEKRSYRFYFVSVFCPGFFYQNNWSLFWPDVCFVICNKSGTIQPLNSFMDSEIPAFFFDKRTLKQKSGHPCWVAWFMAGYRCIADETDEIWSEIQSWTVKYSKNLKDIHKYILELSWAFISYVLLYHIWTNLWPHDIDDINRMTSSSSTWYRACFSA